MMMKMTQVVQCEEVGSGSSFTLNFVFVLTAYHRRVSLEGQRSGYFRVL
jgi:hypothetical protein